MKRLLIIALALCLALAPLAGCARPPQGDYNPDENPDFGNWEDGPKTLSVYTVGGPLHYDYKENDPDPDFQTTQYIIDTFKVSHPGVTVKMDGGAWGTDLNNALRELYMANKMPDIVVGELFNKTQINDLEYYQHMAVPQDIKDAIRKPFWDQCTGDDGRIYGYPMFTGCSALIYNENLVRAAGLVNPDGSLKIPETMDELKNYAAQVYSNSGGSVGGLLVNAVPGIPSAYRNIVIMQMFGGGFYNDAGDIIINGAESKAAMQWIKDVAAYAYSGNAALGEEGQVNKLFLDNKVAFAIESGPLTYARDIPTSQFKSAPLPVVEGVPSTNMLVGSPSYMMTRASRNKALAQEFLNHLVSYDVQKQIYMCSSNRVPVRDDLILDLLASDDPDVQAKNAFMSPFIESLYVAENLVAGLPGFDANFTKIWGSWTTAIQNILGNGQSVAANLDNFAADVIAYTAV